jgi:predicted nuclease of predicted toxin-antitoxin system
MKILLDECTPVILKRRLTDFEITTVQELGWAGIKNGELLSRAEQHYEVFITTDKNLRYQQNLADKQLAIIELPTNEVPIVDALAPAVAQVLVKIRPGDFVAIPLP